MPENNYSLVNKSLHKTIFKLSLPGMVSSVLQTLFQLVDAYWVGKLGAEALAAIGGCAFVIWAVYSLTALSVNGITTLVAQNIGSGKKDEAKFSAGQGMLVNTVSGLILAVTVYFLQDDIYKIMGFTPVVFEQARNYMTIILFGLVFSFWFAGLEGIFRGIGDTKTPMIVLAVALTLNAILDPVFIFGWLGFPAMGVGGAALATVITIIFAVVLLAGFLRKEEIIPTIKHSGKIYINSAIIQRILRIGSPIAAGGFFFSLIYVLLTNIISEFGTEAIAAVGVCHRIEGIAYFACVGFSVAASTLVGQNVGAKRYKQAEKATWWVNAYGVIIMFIISIIFYFFPEWLMRIFTTDSIVQEIGVQYLKIIAVFEIFLAFEVIMEGAFSGAGYTLPVMLVTVPITFARIPAAWYLAIYLDMGVTGIWWAIASTTFLKGLLNTILFALGLWKRKLSLAPSGI